MGLEPTSIPITSITALAYKYKKKTTRKPVIVVRLLIDVDIDSNLTPSLVLKRLAVTGAKDIAKIVLYKSVL